MLAYYVENLLNGEYSYQKMQHSKEKESSLAVDSVALRRSLTPPATNMS